ncbi:MAG: hypothetical protein VKL41_02870 [Snowella sp.]|nr:hypothetical protein [Snowella sp.]
MNRPIRIGLIAEGKTELGSSISNINPEEGGKIISKENEGALHRLIRRELKEAGLTDCDFVYRHPSTKEINNNQQIMGHRILTRKYLSQTVSTWTPEEVDLIMITADADNLLIQRQRELKSALEIIRDNHLDINEKKIEDQTIGGLAIKNFETWLLADTQTISKILDIEIPVLENLEDLEDSSKTKKVLEQSINESNYLLEENNRNLRTHKIKWILASEVDLEMLKKNCPQGYGLFSQDLLKLTQIFIQKLL